MPLTFRKAEANDADALTGLALRSNESGAMTSVLSHGIVAEDDGEPVGYAIVRIDGECAYLATSLASQSVSTRNWQSAVPGNGFYERLGMRKVGEEPSSVGGGRTLPITALDI